MHYYVYWSFLRQSGCWKLGDIENGIVFIFVTGAESLSREKLEWKATASDGIFAMALQEQELDPRETKDGR